MSERHPAVRSYLLLYAALLIYSLNGIFSKLASKNQFLSTGFIMYYVLALFILFVYAVLWQQILKKIPLTTAFSNKSVTVILGMLWGALLFQEHISWQMLVGGAVIILGIYLVVTDHE